MLHWNSFYWLIALLLYQTNCILLMDNLGAGMTNYALVFKKYLPAVYKQLGIHKIAQELLFGMLDVTIIESFLRLQHLAGMWYTHMP